MSVPPRVVVVTGGSAGVGRATAREFAQRGDRVAVIARDEQRLRETEKELQELAGAGLGISADVADARAVEDAAAQIESELGPIDVWVNNAMASVFGRVIDLSAQEIKRVTEVTYLGSVHGVLTALDHMRPRNRGVIVQVGSALAYRAIPAQAAYCASKHAIRGFVDSLRTELMEEGSDVSVVSVHLPALNTPQFDWSRLKFNRRPQPVPPIFQPEVAARSIVAAADHPGREVWVGGPTVATILANRLAPSLLDRYLARNGVKSQLTEDPADPDAPGNLFLTVEGDYAAHGRFDDRAKPRSLQADIRNRIAGLVARILP
ncbi:MAG: SDR family oxidoreductase [Actinobacteria bacterium]|nr:SDR family oxidoreductase [Actinomycetota bacterium]